MAKLSTIKQQQEDISYLQGNRDNQRKWCNQSKKACPMCIRIHYFAGRSWNHGTVASYQNLEPMWTHNHCQKCYCRQNKRRRNTHLPPSHTHQCLQLAGYNQKSINMMICDREQSKIFGKRLVIKQLMTSSRIMRNKKFKNPLSILLPFANNSQPEMVLKSVCAPDEIKSFIYSLITYSNVH